MPGLGNASHSIDTTEALAAGVGIIPPSPSVAPLSNTLEDVGGIESSAAGSERNTIVNPTTSSPKSLSDEHKEGAQDSTSPRNDHPSLADPIDEKKTTLSPTSPHHTLASNKTTKPSPPVRAPLTAIRAFCVVAIVTTTMVMNAGGQQSLNIALPTIQTDLNMEETDLQWIASAYSLTNGCFLLLAGRLADVHGRKFIFLCGITWSAIWNLAGGFIKSPVGLIVSRALAGSGAAMSIPSAIGIVAQNFNGRARSTAFASFSAGAPIGGGVGLVLGGLLTSYVTWRAVLWVFAGIGGVIGITAFLVVPPDVIQTVDKRIDWVGAALITAGLIMLQFVVSDGESAPQGWRTGYIIAMLIVSILLIVTFFLWERHVINNTSRPPLMRLQLWTRAKGRLAAMYFIGFVSWMGFTSLLYHATLFFQQVQGTGPIGAMLRFIPTSVSGVLCNVIVAYLINLVPTQWIICAGILATGLANILMALSDAGTNYWQYPFQSMWMGVMGADFLMATGSVFVSVLSLPEEQSVAGALFQTLIQLGGSFGLAITAVIYDSFSTRVLNSGGSDADAIATGLRAAFYLGGGCSFLAMLASVGMLNGMGIIGKGVGGKGGHGGSKGKESEVEERRVVEEDVVGSEGGGVETKV